MCKVFGPADCGLKIKRLAYARDNGIRIEALSPDIEKIKAHPGLADAGFMVRENTKSNPRLIVHGVPAEMTAEEIRSELVAQNLRVDFAGDLKVVYVFTP